jgi:phospholipase/carboxylesterase
MNNSTAFYTRGIAHDLKQEVIEVQQGEYLEFLVREPKIISTRRKAIVLLHGVGSNEQDLFRFSDRLPDDMYVISPRAPLVLADGKFAWYHVDFSSGKPVINSEEEIAARSVILNLLDQLSHHFQLDDIFLGGFSQGAIMSYTIGLLYPEKIKGIVALSGRVLEEIKPLVNDKRKSIRDLSVFIGHGTADNVLSATYAEEASRYLNSLGAQVTYRNYPIGHQVNNDLLSDLSTWLKATK